ncbi:hypothetical protein BD560DRAFT_383895 [Blakeslea trispora]|nr:hypothetical protein BD560DRAFT_383866 [Blakeslea trispora]KAI8385624.1 hypothetical protein BD560DRAFT_383895 [Blakeslea trispora]
MYTCLRGSNWPPYFSGVSLVLVSREGCGYFSLLVGLACLTGVSWAKGLSPIKHTFFL